MNTKKQFRIALYPGGNSLTETLALLSATSNGGDKITLLEIKGIFEAEKRLYPTLTADTNCELIGNDRLHIDKKTGDKWETVLELVEVEVMELESGEDDIPVGMFQAPGINGYNAD